MNLMHPPCILKILEWCYKKHGDSKLASYDGSSVDEDINFSISEEEEGTDPPVSKLSDIGLLNELSSEFEDVIVPKKKCNEWPKPNLRKK